VDVEEGEGFINIRTHVTEPITFWNALRTKIAALPITLIVVAEGLQAWDDYLLLHHFDAQQDVDERPLQRDTKHSL
jgi:hypothetical protein